MSDTSTAKLNVCLLPPGDVAARLVNAARSMPREEQVFAIDGTLRLPHMTIYMSEFTRPPDSMIANRLKSFLGEQRINCTAYGVTASTNNYIEVGYNKTRQLAELQVSIASLVADLSDARQGFVPDDLLGDLRRDTASGYSLFGQRYRPHITLGMYGPQSPIHLPAITDYSAFDFESATLALARSDEYGSVVEVLA